jgi:hypothetical protein
MPHHVDHSCINVIPGHCCVFGHFCTNIILDYCYTTMLTHGSHCCATIGFNNETSGPIFYKNATDRQTWTVPECSSLTPEHEEHLETRTDTHASSRIRTHEPSVHVIQYRARLELRSRSDRHDLESSSDWNRSQGLSAQGVRKVSAHVWYD